MSESDRVCINCGSSVETPYCGFCGQQNPPKKLHFNMLIGELQRRIYGFDGTFPRTVRDLTLVPGEVARQFLNGNRVRYVGPVGYFFLVLTIFLLTMQILEIDLYTLSTSSTPIHVEETERQKIVSKRIIEIFQNNMRTFSFLQIPITALFAWLFFRKHRYNYLENSVLVFYTTGHLMWLSVINLFFFLLFEWNFSMWQILINAAFFGFACVDFYVRGSKVSRFVKGILVAITSYIFFMILGMVAAIVYLFSNPEMMEMLRKTKG